APKSDTILRIRGSLSDLAKTIRLPPSIPEHASTYSLFSAFARTLALQLSLVGSLPVPPSPRAAVQIYIPQPFDGAAVSSRHRSPTLPLRAPHHARAPPRAQRAP